MELKKIEKRLQKVNLFFESIKEDNEISNIERDLLLSYIRNLYDTVLHSEKSNSKIIVKEEVVVEQKKEEVVIKEDVSIPVEEETVADMLGKPVEDTTAEMEEPDSSPEVMIEVENVSEPEVEIIEEIQEELPDAIKELFEEVKITELSDKLGMMPIKDLTKAMGINEKLFTVAELFGGDMDSFKEHMKNLNDLENFDEARNYMIREVAEKYNWGSESKLKKAAHFIRLVQRRFR